MYNFTGKYSYSFDGYTYTESFQTKYLLLDYTDSNILFLFQDETSSKFVEGEVSLNHAMDSVFYSGGDVFEIDSEFEMKGKMLVVDNSKRIEGNLKIKCPHKYLQVSGPYTYPVWTIVQGTGTFVFTLE
ncbi:MAG: hypothetical protein IPH24_11025 [Crocinitomicaceae bacterium]|nr:hypothetical protein [Crocinitomicaceae bacterium]